MLDRGHWNGRSLASSLRTRLDRRCSGTLFKKEIKAGDAIEVGHPVTMTSEIRVVKMVVADGSLSIKWVPAAVSCGRPPPACTPRHTLPV